VQPAHAARNLAVGGERVGQAGKAEHLPVHGDEQHRRRDRAHRVAGDVEQHAGLVAADDCEDRRVDVALGERGAVVDHRSRHERRH
jgi:hypothetical protein